MVGIIVKVVGGWVGGLMCWRGEGVLCWYVGGLMCWYVGDWVYRLVCGIVPCGLREGWFTR